jgi:hypothetical protein
VPRRRIDTVAASGVVLPLVVGPIIDTWGLGAASLRAVLITLLPVLLFLHPSRA